MGAIDVGSAAENRTLASGAEFTYIDLTNPANDTGTLTSVELWCSANATGMKVGTFSGSGTDYDDRDYESIGNVTAGSKQTFSGLSCTVNSGDFIGIYFASGGIERSGSGGSGVYYVAGDKFGSGSATYALLSGDMISVYGIGATGGWANIGKINGIASASISKVNGVAVASISKVNGVAV